MRHLNAARHTLLALTLSSSAFLSSVGTAAPALATAPAVPRPLTTEDALIRDVSPHARIVSMC
jgi:hypothetical protein